MQGEIHTVAQVEPLPSAPVAGVVPAVSKSASSLVLSYMALRRSIGAVGILLPFVLLFGQWWGVGGDLQPTISDYYHTPMRDYFVSSLSIIGALLLTYLGYDWRDKLAGRLAGFFAFGVALLPTTPHNPSTLQSQIGIAHLTCAMSLFACFAYFCLVLFRSSGGSDAAMTAQKHKRNRVYLASGWAIILSMGGAIVYWYGFPEDPWRGAYPLFCMETIAVCAFSISWLVKGEAIFADKE